MSYLGWVTATKIWLPWDIQAGATAAVFIWLGYIVKANAILTIRPSKWIVCICLMIMAWCIRYFNGFWMVTNYFGNGIMDFIGAFAISYLIYWSVKLCFIHCNNFSKVLSWYGKYSLVILCFHIIELDLFPWAVFMSFIVSMGINKFVMWSIIIICKLVWVTFGVFIVLNVPVLRKIFNA